MLLYSDAIAATAIDFAAEKQCDAIILGASREGLLQQTIPKRSLRVPIAQSL